MTVIPLVIEVITVGQVRLHSQLHYMTMPSSPYTFWRRIQARITNWNIHLLMICHCQVSNFFSFAMEFLDKNLHFTALLIESSIGVHPIGVYLQFYQTGCMNHNYGFAIIFHRGKLTEFLLALLGLTSSASIHLPYSTHGRCIMLFQGYNWLVYCLLLRTHS